MCRILRARKMRYNGQAQRPIYNKHEAREQAGRGTPKAAQRGGRPTARPPDITGLIYFEWEPGGRPTTAGGKQGARRADGHPHPQAPPAPAAGAAGGPPPERRGPEPATAGGGTPRPRTTHRPERFSAHQAPARGHVMLTPPPPIHGVRKALWGILCD